MADDMNAAASGGQPQGGAAAGGASDAGGMPPSGADNAAEAGPEQVAQQFQAIRQAMSQSLEALSKQSGFPPEGTKALTSALQSYTQFMQVLGSYLHVDMGMDSGKDATMGMQMADQAGVKNAVPADQPMGKNIRAVPA